MEAEVSDTTTGLSDAEPSSTGGPTAGEHYVPTPAIGKPEDSLRRRPT